MRNINVWRISLPFLMLTREKIVGNKEWKQEVGGEKKRNEKKKKKK